MKRGLPEIKNRPAAPDMKEPKHMNSYLVTYEYSYNEEPHKFTTVVEGDTYKEAAVNFTKENSPATMLAIKVLPSAETNYTQLKNHLHNTLHLSKAHVRKLVEEAVHDIVERKIDVMFKYDDVLPRIIDQAVREHSFSKLMWGDDKSLDEVLQQKVVKEVTKKLISDIGLEVNLVKKNDRKKDSNNTRKTS